MEELTPAQRALREKHARANVEMGADMLKVAGPAVMLAMIGAFVALIIMICAAGIRGAWMLAKALPLYPLAILAAIVVLAFVWKYRRIRYARKFLAIAAAALVAFFGCKGATAYYNNSGRVFASVYSADYVQTLPDGSAPKLYEKRNGRGEASALAVDEKVAVNGISFDYREFNITTADGRTGWVERAVFPEEAADMLALSIGLDGVDAWDQTIDRETERLMGRFYDIEQKGGGQFNGYDVVEYKEFTLKPGIMNRFTRVGVQTPITYLSPKALKRGEPWGDDGTKITLAGVAYEPDCTVVALTLDGTGNGKETPYYWVPYGGNRNSAAWKAALVATDLDTGETWHPMPADYEKAWTLEERKETQLFFFPPFKSRHFSLTHGGVSPLPDGKTKSGYGGILGLMSSATGMSGEDSKFYLEWNFPEINLN